MRFIEKLSKGWEQPTKISKVKAVLFNAQTIFYLEYIIRCNVDEIVEIQNCKILVVSIGKRWNLSESEEELVINSWSDIRWKNRGPTPFSIFRRKVEEKIWISKMNGYVFFITFTSFTFIYTEKILWHNEAPQASYGDGIPSQGFPPPSRLREGNGMANMASLVET